MRALLVIFVLVAIGGAAYYFYFLKRKEAIPNVDGFISDWRSIDKNKRTDDQFIAQAKALFKLYDYHFSEKLSATSLNQLMTEFLTLERKIGSDAARIVIETPWASKSQKAIVGQI
ncbi:MAG: hypothetical protein IM574_10815 [Cytophagales bacterium]|jgi:hypothetical protein|nr:hypothetical protein [Cytophagales bacterium]MCA6387525.1 hypothetical protein [Cytophagales bacterium]MCA6391196.1 hypothetical protein [Cytophagales bacterium]MCA6395834.1 hypothetical protein [Cytophagales bacterium]MCA6397659.1 hypothetical protein [Cytophagales bacterium]